MEMRNQDSKTSVKARVEIFPFKKTIEPLAFLIVSHFKKHVFTYHSYTLFTNRLNLSLDSTSPSADWSLHTIVPQ